MLALVTVSCETYDDYNAERKTVVGFAVPSKNINNIREDEPKSIEVDLFVSDLSSVDREVQITTFPSILPDADPPSVETDPENYSYDATVTIPANTQSGIITITGMANSIEDERGEYFTLGIQGNGDIVSGGRILVRVKAR